jgi:hypothetical protein
MLNTQLPTTRYNKTTYANLEDRADGAPVPIAYGNLHDVMPTCINTSTQLFKLAEHAIHAIDEIRTDTETLVVTADYTADLPNAQFSLLATPYLAANTTYYLVIEADYVVSGTDHLHLKQFGATYANGSIWAIDGSSVWSADTAHDLRFQIYGKKTLDGQEQIKVKNNVGTATNIGLRDAATRTRLAQSFKTGATGFYATRVNVWISKTGAPAGNVRVSILSAYTPAEVQLGAKSAEYVIGTTGNTARFFFPLRAEVSNLACDIEGVEKTGAPIVDGADMLEDLVVTRLGKTTAGLLDAAALADFKTNRAQVVKAYIDRDMTFGEILGKLEASLLFKFAPLHDGTYAPTVYAAGEPAGTPHFFDEHYLSFSMCRDSGAVKSIIKVKYDENPTNQEFKAATVSSNVAKFVYGINETQEVETYLADGTEAAALATSYSTMYETPPLGVTFEIRGYGLNLIPGRDKVKLTRTNAAYAGGTLAGVLFRITKLTKKPASASTEIVCVLDTQTY